MRSSPRWGSISRDKFNVWLREYNKVQIKSPKKGCVKCAKVQQSDLGVLYIFVSSLQ